MAINEERLQGKFKVDKPRGAGRATGRILSGREAYVARMKDQQRSAESTSEIVVPRRDRVSEVLAGIPGYPDAFDPPTRSALETFAAVRWQYMEGQITGTWLTVLRQHIYSKTADEIWDNDAVIAGTRHILNTMKH